jgi:hypothetical protein
VTGLRGSSSRGSFAGFAGAVVMGISGGSASETAYWKKMSRAETARLITQSD